MSVSKLLDYNTTAPLNLNVRANNMIVDGDLEADIIYAGEIVYEEFTIINLVADDATITTLTTDMIHGITGTFNNLESGLIHGTTGTINNLTSVRILGTTGTITNLTSDLVHGVTGTFNNLTSDLILGTTGTITNLTSDIILGTTGTINNLTSNIIHGTTGTINNAIIGTILFANHVDQTLLDFYRNGSRLMTATYSDGHLESITIHYTRVGNAVTLFLPAFYHNITSGSGQITIGELPTYLIPPASVVTVILVVDNGALGHGLSLVNNIGEIKLSPGNSIANTFSTGSGGLPYDICLNYTLY